MDFLQKTWEEIGISCGLSSYISQLGPSEYHVQLHVSPQNEGFAQQYARLQLGFERVCAELLPADARPVLKRYFVSDATNQAPLMESETACTVSVIQQPPLDGSKISLWVYFLTGADVQCADGVTTVEHGGYRHFWHMGMESPAGDSAVQTEALLTRYEDELTAQGATIADDCVRTWFFVRDVDTNYAGLVKARLDNFLRVGLTPDTHYISSTGIGGLPADTRSLVQLGGYAVKGLEPGQQRYLYALTHLNPTIEYGVTFERGTVVEYGDRAQAFISGTASIDNKGQVVHVGDIVRQTHRMWENVDALLAEAEMNLAEHAAQITVYLRDTADYVTVRDLFAARFPHVPTVITLAPVCRPEWLIEMECIAVADRQHETYRPF